MEINDIKLLKDKSKELRIDTLKMIFQAGSGHLGGSYSIAEILSVLYFKEMRIDPKRPYWENRDRLVLSKGHVCPIVYAALAKKGYFPLEELETLRKIGSRLQGHPDMKKLPGIDMTSGSLGNGLGIGTGMSIGAKVDNRDFRVYVILGDGELQEGSVWEAAMYSANKKLDNLVVIIDKNNLQVDGFVNDINRIDPLDEKWRSFGFHVITIDGHNIEEIYEALQEAKTIKGKPTCIIAKTVKGKGVEFFENVCEWHGKAPNEEEYSKALIELEEA
ncbi:transketolase [Paeniclostridium hominis]|uniref:transketolase n=1 Tax=Paeniclostridium hominis TaxID=2764329 RepID=UPI0022E44882|nr:transketolase [Paeniclostridium hominis]